MANTVKQGAPGQLIEQQGSINVRGGIKVWNGSEFVSVATADDIEGGAPTVATYADMISLVQSAISSEEGKPYRILVLEDETMEFGSVVYDYFPGPPPTLLQIISTKIDI